MQEDSVIFHSLFIQAFLGFFPPINMITKDHLKAILSNHKKLLKLQEVNFVSMPMYDECSVK